MSLLGARLDGSLSNRRMTDRRRLRVLPRRDLATRSKGQARGKETALAGLVTRQICRMNPSRQSQLLYRGLQVRRQPPRRRRLVVGRRAALRGSAKRLKLPWGMRNPTSKPAAAAPQARITRGSAQRFTLSRGVRYPTSKPAAAAPQARIMSRATACPTRRRPTILWHSTAKSVWMPKRCRSRTRAHLLPYRMGRMHLSTPPFAFYAGSLHRSTCAMAEILNPAKFELPSVLYAKARSSSRAAASYAVHRTLNLRGER